MPNAPYYAVYNVGEYTFAPWKVVWPEQPGNNGLPVAVVNTRILRGVGDKVVIPDHKIYFAEFNEPTRAYYLCGILSSSLVQKFISSFHIMLQVGDIFKYMRLPEFDATNEEHMRLVELTRAAHGEENPERKELLLIQVSETARYRQVLCANSFTSLAELSLHRAGKPALNYLVAEDRERVKGGEAACEALDVNSVFCYQPASSSCISMCFMLMYFFPPHWVPAT